MDKFFRTVTPKAAAEAAPNAAIIDAAPVVNLATPEASLNAIGIDQLPAGILPHVIPTPTQSGKVANHLHARSQDAQPRDVVDAEWLAKTTEEVVRTHHELMGGQTSSKDR